MFALGFGVRRDPRVDAGDDLADALLCSVCDGVPRVQKLVKKLASCRLRIRLNGDQ
jgi:hypothetical protein